MIEVQESRKMNEFRLGDRVRTREGVTCGGVSSPRDGTVLEVLSLNHGTVLVEFDKHIMGHAGTAVNRVKGKAGHCWNVHVTDLVLLEGVQA